MNSKSLSAEKNIIRAKYIQIFNPEFMNELSTRSLQKEVRQDLYQIYQNVLFNTTSAEFNIQSNRFIHFRLITFEFSKIGLVRI